MSLYSQALQFIITGLINGSIYAVVALGFSIIHSTTGVINFAQGEFVMLGALLMVTLTAPPPPPPQAFAMALSGAVLLGAGLTVILTALRFPKPLALVLAGFGSLLMCKLLMIILNVLPLPTLLAFALAVAGTVLVGALLERLALRPVRHSSIVTLVIITIGASILLRGAAMLIWGTDPQPLKPFSESAPLLLGDAVVVPQGIWVIGITVGLVILLHFLFGYTSLGKAMRACAMNPQAARLVGVSVERTVLGSFALSAGLGAVAGILIAPISGAGYDMGTMLGLKGFCAVMLGGLGSSVGAILGGFSLGIAQELGAGFGFSGYKDAIAFFVLLLILFIKPTGLLGRMKDRGL